MYNGVSRSAPATLGLLIILILYRLWGVYLELTGTDLYPYFDSYDIRIILENLS